MLRTKWKILIKLKNSWWKEKPNLGQMLDHIWRRLSCISIKVGERVKSLLEWLNFCSNLSALLINHSLNLSKFFTRYAIHNIQLKQTQKYSFHYSYFIGGINEPRWELGFNIDFRCHESIKDINFSYQYNIFLHWQTRYANKGILKQNHDWVP